MFDYIIDTRLRNDEIDDTRRAMSREIDRLKDKPMPKYINLEDPKSIEAYTHQWEVKRKTKSNIKENLGFNVTENNRSKKKTVRNPSKKLVTDSPGSG